MLNAAPADLASANDDFVFFVRLPVEPFGKWPRADRLRALLGPSAHLLMCVLVNKQGDEFQLVMPRALADAERPEVLDCFAAALSSRDLWTDRPPDEQHAADAAWPRVWYYESQGERPR